MAKIIIKSTLNNISQNTNNICNTNGILNDNKITYFDSKKKVTIEIFNNNIVMYRYENSNNYIKIIFDEINPVCEYHLNNNIFNMDIKIKKININNNISVHYIINDEELIFNFEYESVIE